MSRVVCTVAVGDAGHRLHELTRPSQRDYAERVGADYVVLRGPEPKYRLGPKLRVGELLGRYDRVMFVDADAFFAGDAEDLFDLVDEDLFAIHDDFPLLQSVDWLQREQAALAESQQWEPVAPACLNTGVMVFSRAHAAAFERPLLPFPKYHCSEQHLVTMNLVRHAIPLFRLPRIWNWQWWADPAELHRSDARVMHWARPVKVTEAERLERMRAFAYGGRPAAECSHRGRRPTAEDRQRYSLDTIRDWRQCEVKVSHGRGPYVCPCTGCGPKCDLYSPGGLCGS